MIADSAKHLEALRTSSRLTETFRRMYRREAAQVEPEDVVRVLKVAGAKFILMGTHGVGGWRSHARATEDVDVLVAKKDHRKAIQALRRAFPQLTVEDYPVVTRFIDPATGKQLIDLMKPNQPLFEVAFKNTVRVEDSHLVPDLEMALASKFAAMVSPNRAYDKKLIDGGDFVNIVNHNRAAIDLKKLKRLGERVYPGGGIEVLKLVEDIRAGRRLQI